MQEREAKVMTWKEKTICRILLLIAGMMAEDSDVKQELRTLGNHISVGLGEGR